MSTSDFSSLRAGGRQARQPSAETIIRDLQSRLSALERAFSQNAQAVQGDIQNVQTAPSNVSTYHATTPTTSWTITHNMNRYVIAQVFDDNGYEIIVDVRCPDVNTLVISSDIAFTGTAVVS